LTESGYFKPWKRINRTMIKKLLLNLSSSKEKKKDVLQREAALLNQRLIEICKQWPAQGETDN